MKRLLMILPTLMLCLSSAHAKAPSATPPAEGFDSVLAKIQNSNWKGDFNLRAFGVINCSGPLDVKFFPSEVEDFSDGATTVSYRHDADFSGNKNWLCRTVGKALSVVDIDKCADTFPLKYSPEENKNVPFRTIIPRAGNKAFVSSPSCKRNGTVVRDELELVRADLSENDNRLDLTIRLMIQKSVIDLKYVLKRQ